jgi:hypothetical protein
MNLPLIAMLILFDAGIWLHDAMLMLGSGL